MDRAAAADVLVTLVACQEANVALDQADRREAKANTWSAAQQRSFDWLFQQQEDGEILAATHPNSNSNNVGGASTATTTGGGYLEDLARLSVPVGIFGAFSFLSHWRTRHAATARPRRRRRPRRLVR